MNIKFREYDSSEYKGKKMTKAINTPSWSLHVFEVLQIKTKKLTTKHMVKKTKIKAMRKFKTKPKTCTDG